MEYGPHYDTALKDLMWELLSCLERLFPVPDFKKVHIKELDKSLYDR